VSNGSSAGDNIWGVLDGLRVLEVSRTAIGAYAGKLFREYGADVVLVEDPDQSPTEVRTFGPFRAEVSEPGEGGLHRYLHAGKRGVSILAAHPDGRALVQRLAGVADLVLHEYPEGEARARGLTYDQIAAANPRCVVLAVTPFGQSGPYANWRATENILFALSGRMNMQGTAGRPPLAYAPLVVASQIAATAAGAALAALYQAGAGGAGRGIDVSGLEAQLGTVDNLFLAWTMAEHEVPRGFYPPYTYPCADGYVLLGAVGPRYLIGLANALGRPELLSDARFNTPVALAQHQEEFDEIVIPYFLQHTRAALVAALQEHGVMCSPLQTAADAPDNPQFAARDFFQPLDTESDRRVPGPSFRLEQNARPPIPARAPWPGQHDRTVLTEWLSLADDEIVKLSRLGAIA
jgi:crotonobetainyl-CoA:carnitine CoA-transferase CaiB-like acyl-CoA transferase